jgi:hypothetical protein
MMAVGRQEIVPIDALSVLANIETTLRVNPAPDAESLKAIRQTLDDNAFSRALQEHIRGLNNRDTVAELQTRILRSSRECGDLSESRRVHSEIGIRVGVTSGVGLMISSIIAALTAGIPFVAPITVVGGAWMTAVGYKYGMKLNEEAKIYKDIAERLQKIAEGINVA